MAATLVNLSGFTFGFGSAETGVNLAKMTKKIDSKKLMVPDIQGAGRGYVDYDPVDETTLEGEMTGTTGLAASKLAVAATIANEIAVDFGAGLPSAGGGAYVQNLTVEKGREELYKITINTARRPGIT